MSSTLMSVKGQVVIPKALRDARRWAPGTRFEVRETAEGVMLTPILDAAIGKRPLAEGLAALRQRAGYAGPTVSLAEMDAAVQLEASRRNTESRKSGPGKR